MDQHQWQPSATLEDLRQRAAIIQQIRSFFINRHYLEVDTPIMAHHGITDPYLCNIQAIFRGNPYQLQTSPEYHMKRLLAAGSGPIFQLAKSFRDDELGRWHNPEFTLLEWYQLDITHHELMHEMDEFLREILNCNPLIKKTYQQAFLEACDFNPFLQDHTRLNNVLDQFDLQYVFDPEDTDWDSYLHLLMSHVVEPHLAKLDAPVAIYNFPVSQASLAKVNEGVAERFEVYYGGVELANGFHELTDARAQRKRFIEDNTQRQVKGIAVAAADEFLLQALEHGLPHCSGVALGIDRLLALCLNKSSIAQVQTFDISRA